MKHEVSSFYKQFRVERGQEEEKYIPPFQEKKNISYSKPVTKKRKFLEKYGDIENTIDSFDSTDLAFFFQQKAKENGIRYEIVNMRRDVGIFKNLLKHYQSHEICLMVEFLFESNQDYLNVRELQPTVLSSGWSNKIYQDAMLWIDDEYIPKSESRRSEREWIRKNKEDIKIGVWE